MMRTAEGKIFFRSSEEKSTHPLPGRRRRHSSATPFPGTLLMPIIHRTQPRTERAGNSNPRGGPGILRERTDPIKRGRTGGQRSGFYRFHVCFDGGSCSRIRPIACLRFSGFDRRLQKLLPRTFARSLTENVQYACESAYGRKAEGIHLTKAFSKSWNGRLKLSYRELFILSRA